MSENILHSKNFERVVLGVLGVLALFLFAKIITEFKQYGVLDNQIPNIISVNGTGEVYAKADIASVSFSVNESDKTVFLAQQKATEKNNKVFDFLKKSGIEEKDIKTVGYNINPKYDIAPCAQEIHLDMPSGVSSISPCSSYYPKSVLVGYEVTESVDVKIRDVSKAGDILSGIGKLNVSNVSGLSFTIDNQDALKAEARKNAIEDAKSKAKKIAEDLGTSLGKVTSFYENVDSPMYYDYKSSVSGMGGGVAPVSSPIISTGQNKITVNVSVTYRLN